MEINEKKLLEEEVGVKSTETGIKLPSTLGDIKEKRIIERGYEKNAPTTGYERLDDLIKGFVPGHLYTLTGETNVGKSSIASNFAVAVAKQKKRVLYVALEPDNTIIDYIASVYHDKRFDELTEDDLSLTEISIDVLGKDDNIDSATKMVKLIETYDRYDLIVIDHIGYFITSQNNYLQEQSNTIKQLVSIAKKRKCAVMIIAHLRKRGKNDKRNYTPSIDDISGSGSFKQDSTEVLVTTREIDENDEDKIKYTDKGKLFVLKNKSGPNGVIRLYFSDRKAKISSDEIGETDKTIRDIFGVVPS